MNIYRKKVERVTLVFQNTDGTNSKDLGKAFAYCHKHGYRIVHSGPVTHGRRVDFTKFKIVGERTLK